MSRSIAESVKLLKDTLDDVKAALKEKEVTPPEDLKFSDVDEQIDKIGG